MANYVALAALTYVYCQAFNVFETLCTNSIALDSYT